MCLHKTHPARAAGSKHRELVLFRMGNLLDKLGALFHNGQVRAEVGIKYVIHSCSAQRGSQSLHGCEFRVQAEGLSPCGTDGRCNLYNRDLLRILDGLDHPIHIIALTKGADRTVGNTLAAECALGILQTVHAGDIDSDAGTGIDHIPHVCGLDLVADLDTAHALDALVIITDQREFHASLLLLQLLLVGKAVDIQVIGHLLQCTVAAADTDSAVGIVLGKDELDIGLSRIPCLLGIGMNNHAVRHRIIAGGEQSLIPLNFHNADAACADLVEFFHITERRNMDSCL